LGVPWLGWLTAGLFGVEEFEFETELVVTAMFVIFGTYWCSWLCPFGNLNYFIGKLGAKLFPHAQLNIPTAIDKPLRYVKYAALLLFIWAMVTHGVNYFFDDHMNMYHATWLTSF
jgi:polyferredoxin